MNGYKWFKHLSNSIQADKTLRHAEEKMGLEGYAMALKLREHMAAQTEFGSDIPYCELTISGLCKALSCRKSKVEKFIQVLESSGEFKIEKNQENIRFESPNFKKLLDNRAISSNLRAPSGGPNKERLDLPEPIKNDEKLVDLDKPVFASSFDFFKTVNKILSQNGMIALNELPNHFKKHILSIGKADIDVKNQLISIVKKRFSTSDKAQTLGDDIVVKIEDTFTFVDNHFKFQQEKIRKEARDKKIKEKIKDSPDKNDPICSKVIRRAKDDYGIETIKIEDFEYTYQELCTYWGEEHVNEEYKKLVTRMNFLKNKASKQKTSEAVHDDDIPPSKSKVQYDDDDEEDDDHHVH